jgi:hypothetical protein
LFDYTLAAMCELAHHIKSAPTVLNLPSYSPVGLYTHHEIHHDTHFAHIAHTSYILIL